MTSAAGRSRVTHLLLFVFMSLCIAAPVSAQVKITQTPEQIAVDINGKPFTVLYIGGKDLNRPYLHPLRSASGKIVNRSFPAGQLPGDPLTIGVREDGGNLRRAQIARSEPDRIEPAKTRILGSDMTALTAAPDGPQA